MNVYLRVTLTHINTLRANRTVVTHIIIVKNKVQADIKTSYAQACRCIGINVQLVIAL